MSVTYTLVEENTTDGIIGTAQTARRGINIPGGPIDAVIIRLNTTLNNGDNMTGDLTTVLSQLNLVLNGENVFQFVSGFTGNDLAGAGLLNYFINSIGGNYVQTVVSDTVKDGYLVVPVGRQVAAGISRLEYTLGSVALGGTSPGSTTCNMQVWIRYNSGMTQSTTVAPQTSQTLSASTQNVVVRLPANVPGTLAGVFCQNEDGASEGDIMTDIQVLSQSSFAMPRAMWRALNGDLKNGIQYFLEGANASQTYATARRGSQFLPLFGLTMNDDLRLVVTSSAASTCTFTPVIVQPINAKPEQVGTQTERLITSTSGAILETQERNA